MISSTDLSTLLSAPARVYYRLSERKPRSVDLVLLAQAVVAMLEQSDEPLDVETLTRRIGAAYADVTATRVQMALAVLVLAGLAERTCPSCSGTRRIRDAHQPDTYAACGECSR